MARSNSRIYSTVFLLGLIALGWLLFDVATGPGQRSLPGIDARLNSVFGSSSCGDLVRDCVATAEVKIPECDEEVAERRLSEAIGIPIENEGCRDVAREMVSSCPDGCTFDFQGIITVPGLLEVRFSGEPDESGMCLGQAKKPFTLRGTCRR